MSICKNVSSNRKSKALKMLVCLSVVFIIISMFCASAFAAGEANNGGITDPDASFNNVIKFLAGWIGKIGLVVALIGAIQFGFAVRNDDADGKSKAIKATASGFIVFAVTLSLPLFGIN